MDNDYYKTLGVNRNASQAEIQKAYRKMAARYHPDLCEEANKERAKEKFQQIQKAYDVLSDPDKREMYDRYGSSFESMGAGAGGPWQTYSRGGPGFEDFDFTQFFGGRGGRAGRSPFEDIFQQFMRGGAGPGTSTRRARARGADLTHELRVPFKTAIEGGQARLTVRRPSGKVETISVKIPAGIQDGKKIRLRGQGEPSLGGGPPGDLLITVQVEPHPFFRRRGNDLEVKVPVTLAEAALGAKVDVPSPRGTISLAVPPGTSSGRRLRVKGFGVRPPKAAPGDLYAEIQIVLPDRLDDESRRLIQQLAGQTAFDPRASLKW